MSIYGDPEKLWLILTNCVLGLVVLISLTVLVRSSKNYFSASFRKKILDLRNDDHAFVVDGLGLTMADGGKKIEEKKPENARLEEKKSIQKADDE
jgi:hypothetical protein